MFLKKFVFVNWGNVPDNEFDLGPVSLFSGANGSGKTTAADAIQTVMTAAHENLFHYNPGQDESTQRGRGGKRVRTLASYVLGCDDGSYARSAGTDGYIAAVFHPTQRESAEPFTAVVGMQAWLDKSGKQPLAREEQVLFLILPGVELGIDAFIEQRDGVKHVVMLDDIQPRLIARLGKRSVERYDQKRQYLRRLYGALRGKSDAVTEREALAAARAFSRFMAYKPVSSINQFVAEEVLERKDLGEAVRSVSSQLKTIHGMEREAQGLKESADLLEKAGHFAQGYIEYWTDLQALAYTAARGALLEREAQYSKKLGEREATERELADNASQLHLAEQRYAQLRSTVISLEAQRQGIPALQQKDALEGERASFDAKFTGVAATLLTQDQAVQRNLRAVQTLTELLATPSIVADLPQVSDFESQRLLRVTRDTATVGDLDLPRYLQKDLTNDLAMLESHLDEARLAQRAHNELFGYWRHHEGADSRRDTVGHVNQTRRQRYSSISTQLQATQQEIARLEAKQTVYPPYVERAIAAIRAQCPEADARVLCDHVEVTDPRWQSAIEGYLGGARFGIIVDAQYESRVIRVVRTLSGRDNKARVIQGAKALRDAARSKPMPDSVVHVLQFSHAVAQAYVLASYGSVVRVKGEEELPQIARGITADGMGSANYSMFRCDIPDADLVFGAAARERALQARRAEVDKLQADRHEANARMQESARLLEAVDHLTALTYADSLAGLLETHRELRRVEMLLAQLDLREHESLDAQLASLRREETELREHEGTLNGRSGELRKLHADAAAALEDLELAKIDAQKLVDTAHDDLHRVHRHWPRFDLAQRLEYAQQEARSQHGSQIANSSAHLRSRLQKSEHDLSAAIQQHNQKCRPADAIVYVAFHGNYDAALFEQLCELRREIDRIFNILKNNILVEKHEQLKLLKNSFNDAFVSHLCQEIHQSIQDGRRQLELLNKELVSHRFGSDREQYRFAQDWIPEYREYARFFEEVVRNPPAGEETALFGAQLSPKSAKVRDALMDLLLGADEQNSLRELDRIADYRNYNRYEIYKEVEGKEPIAMSEYGTGSGGQLETPAYIIRAASITSALRYAEGDNHLRMVLVDEAFSKMDESRSREVIDYLTGTLGLQLIFIMPTSKCGPFMDLISNEFVFAKVPSPPRGELRTRVLVDRKECNRARIEELWARHRRTVRQQAELDFMSDVETATPE
jgi:uncharacterized protein YdbL (DUF1318 family)